MNTRTRRQNSSKEAGFGYIETLISMTILVVGLVGLLAFLTFSLASSTVSRDDLIAKQKVREALESVFTARNTQQVTFDDIRNASAGGIFVDGYQPICEPNGEGLVGTADSGDPEVMIFPGKDETLGTADDEEYSLDRFERQITIVGAGTDLRQIEVKVRYRTTQGWVREFRVNSFVSRYR
jgi:type II secretory pathway pseudopilin PulG